MIHINLNLSIKPNSLRINLSIKLNNLSNFSNNPFNLNNKLNHLISKNINVYNNSKFQKK